ncbi:STAS domain-containing protein [Actinomadura parmotrematis]|uniref:STAS domain-containing protein n=1 Tax=Actinomadura parmotrematis TaxID=2864039 RepID=A0ABS7FVJ2_9ACTN|nr:STAS domain-containing protein [Actinomadura parmotrematis]MBW8484428.1 STAS domain-containing protein [Actinomadura parmotrematis]
MRVGVAFYDRAVVVALSGPLSQGTVAHAEGGIDSFWPTAPGRALILDLSAVYRACALGVRLLLQVRRRAEAAGTDLVLVTPAGHLTRRLHAYGLIEAFTLCPTLHEALRAFGEDAEACSPPGDTY